MKRLLRVLTIATFVAIPNVAFAQEAGLVLEEVVVTGEFLTCYVPSVV